MTESSCAADSKEVAPGADVKVKPATRRRSRKGSAAAAPIPDAPVAPAVAAVPEMPAAPQAPAVPAVSAAPQAPVAPAVADVPGVPAATDAPEPTHHHPNLGKAPADMLAGFPPAAEEMRRDKVLIAARALEVAIDWDATIAKRYDERARGSLLRDAELLTERLAMCISSDDPRWLAEYAEWIGPIYRRRGVPLADLATICEGIRVATTRLGPGEADARDRALDAAITVFRKNGRLAGDRHKRNALLRWLYRGV